MAPLREEAPDTGYASWYGEKFHGRRTASGEIYNMHAFTAAHRTAPLGSQVEVTNLQNGRSTVVRINDRGPFVKGRIIDVSFVAAKEIGLIQTGTAKVHLKFVDAGNSEKKSFVQVGAYRQKENAQKAREEIAQRFPNENVQVMTSNELHRVWLGPYENEAKAIQRVSSLQDAGYPALLLRR
jgi:rare lipoprotein A